MVVNRTIDAQTASQSKDLGRSAQLVILESWPSAYLQTTSIEYRITTNNSRHGLVWETQISEQRVLDGTRVFSCTDQAGRFLHFQLLLPSPALRLDQLIQLAHLRHEIIAHLRALV